MAASILASADKNHCKPASDQLAANTDAGAFDTPLSQELFDILRDPEIMALLNSSTSVSRVLTLSTFNTLTGACRCRSCSQAALQGGANRPMPPPSRYGRTRSVPPKGPLSIVAFKREHGTQEPAAGPLPCTAEEADFSAVQGPSSE